MNPDFTKIIFQERTDFYTNRHPLEQTRIRLQNQFSSPKETSQANLTGGFTSATAFRGTFRQTLGGLGKAMFYGQPALMKGELTPGEGGTTVELMVRPNGNLLAIQYLTLVLGLIILSMGLAGEFPEANIIGGMTMIGTTFMTHLMGRYFKNNLRKTVVDFLLLERTEGPKAMSAVAG